MEPYPAGSRLYYSVSFKGRPVILDSPLGLEFQTMPPLAADWVVKGESRQVIDESWQRVCGKAKEVCNRCNQVQVSLQETVAPQRKIGLILRAYDDGVAFRYDLPRQRWISSFGLVSERRGSDSPAIIRVGSRLRWIYLLSGVGVQEDADLGPQRR